MTQPSEAVISVEGLVKRYGPVTAVDGVSFTVRRGEVFGFLGPNGAGKSTTLKVLSTLLRKTSGHVRVLGYDVDHDGKAIRQRIGFAMQEIGLDDLATGWDFLVMQGLLYNLSRKEARRRAEDLLEVVGLTAVAQRKVGTYSGGMRRRIDLVAALMHQPDILFLDEPTTGLDPQSRLAIWEYLAQLNRDGVTIMLSTQVMEEADRLCHRLAIIDLGHIVAQGSPQDLKAQVGGDVVTLALDAAGDGAKRAEGLFKARGDVTGVAVDDNRLTVMVPDGAASVPQLVRTLNEAGIAVTNLTVASPTLDDVFFKFTGHQIRTEDTGGDEVGQMMRPWLGLGRR